MEFLKQMKEAKIQNETVQHGWVSEDGELMVMVEVELLGL